jgi:hypothetical protein
MSFGQRRAEPVPGIQTFTGSRQISASKASHIS